MQALSNEVMPKHEALQELNYAAEELIKSSTADQAALIRDPLNDINQRWESLHHDIAKKMVCFCETAFVIESVSKGCKSCSVVRAVIDVTECSRLCDWLVDNRESCRKV